VLVHFNSIIVGALHEIGDAGVTVKPLNTLPPEIVVPVVPVERGAVEVVLGTEDDDAVVAEPVEVVETELELVVDGVGGVVFLSLLHAASAETASTARAEATTGPGRGAIRAMKREATAIRLRILVRHVWIRRYRAEQRQRW
jgi:hypothetical protein